MKRSQHILLMFSFISFGFLAQPLQIKKNSGGLISLGARSTMSAFNHGDFANQGFGLGGQFRVQLAKRLNTDWFADYITGNSEDHISRTDGHIGWSVLYYLTKNETATIRPYLLMGHCFDYTRMVDDFDHSNYMERWSSAVQGGAGMHWNLTPRLDLSLVAQYMFHLGNDVHGERHETGVVEFHKEKGGASLEGHLLFHVSINYKIADLWH